MCFNDINCVNSILFISKLLQLQICIQQCLLLFLYECMYVYLKGFFVLENFFSSSELEPVKTDIDNLVEELAQKLYAANQIKGSIITKYSIILQVFY